MIVLALTDCPIALRGDLTKWLQEVNTGVYVGRSSARVRDELWKRIVKHSGSGRATMVFSADNEQGMDFYVHNTTWEPIDFDGLKLLLRPCPERLTKKQPQIQLRKGFSNAAKNHMARKMAGKRHHDTHDDPSVTDKYVVVDIETTGLSVKYHEIIEIAALRVVGNIVEEKFQALVKPKQLVPSEIEALTGISAELLKNGRDISEVMPEFLSFVGDLHVVCHNADFDYGFLCAACEQCGLLAFSNLSIDTMKIARKNIADIRNYKLATLLDYFGIKVSREHRGLDDCLATQQLYEKLMKI